MTRRAFDRLHRFLGRRAVRRVLGVLSVVGLIHMVGAMLWRLGGWAVLLPLTVAAAGFPLVSGSVWLIARLSVNQHATSQREVITSGRLRHIQKAIEGESR